MSGNSMKLLEGVIDADPPPADERIAELKDEVKELRAAIVRANADTTQARRDAARALAPLRQQLTPLYRALQTVFGELDAAGVTEERAVDWGKTPASSTTDLDPRVVAAWNSWKSRLSPACGKVIDALMVHGTLNSAQIKVAAGLGSSTVSDSIYKLNKAGLIDKNGGRFSLKQL